MIVDIKENWYVSNYADEITNAINEELHIDLEKKYLTLKDIRSMAADVKASLSVSNNIIKINQKISTYKGIDDKMSELGAKVRNGSRPLFVSVK